MRGGFRAECRLLRLSEGIRLRRENFGGIAFDARTGTTVDVDRPAFALLCRVRERGVVREDALAPGRQAAPVVRDLLELGILAVAASHAAGVPHAAAEDVARHGAGRPALPQSHLSAPEVAHWAITYRCGEDCPDCYAARHRRAFATELSTADACRLIDRLADWGVFQLAIGGGEPLEREDLPEVAAHARERGLVAHVSTGRHRVPPSLLKALAPGIRVLLIGVKPDRLLADPRAEAEALRRTVSDAEAAGIAPGASLYLSSTAIAEFERLVHLLVEAGLRRITLLRYKAPATLARWVREKPTSAMLLGFELRLAEAAARHPEVDFRVDCALGFLQRRIPPAEALAAGIRGCVAGDRIVALVPDGTLYPCSQLVDSRLCAGNLLEADPAALWAEAPVLRRYRSYRDSRAFRESPCGVCLAGAHCGGCPAFAHDACGPEPECPDPLMPPLTALGTAGGFPFVTREQAAELLGLGAKMRREGYPRWLLPAADGEGSPPSWESAGMDSEGFGGIAPGPRTGDPEEFADEDPFSS